MTWLILSMMASTTWGQGQATAPGKAGSMARDLANWHAEEERNLDENWTWFGMGYESRNTAGDDSSSADIASLEATQNRSLSGKK